MNITQGRAYCNAIGYRMLTVDELKKFAAASPNLSPDVGVTWPINSSFWLGDRADNKIFLGNPPDNGSVDIRTQNIGEDILSPLPQSCIR